MDELGIKSNRFSIGFLQRAMSEKFSMGEELAYSNFFLVSFPKELNITAYDVVSVDFITDHKCRFVIRNNYDNCPIFSLNAYRNKNKNFFKINKDFIEIDYLNRRGVLKYSSILKEIRIENIKESKLSYEESVIQTITFDVEYNKREIIKPISELNAANKTDK